MTVSLVDRNGKELRVNEDSVDFWLERGYRRKPESKPTPRRAPAKRKQ